MLGWIQCQLLGYRHDPVRHPLGGFRCARCGAIGADFADLGYTGSAYIATVRRVYSRDRADLTRTSSWDTGQYRKVRRPTL